MSDKVEFSLAELMIVAASEAWRGDGEVLASGIGVIPRLGASLAKLTHGPGLLMTDSECFLVEDPIPAGTEAVNPNLSTEQQIGTQPEVSQTNPLSYGWGWWWFSNIEFRDEKVALYATFLPAGTYEFTYSIRAGLPGVYNVIPATGQEFYFPEVYGRSAGSTFTVLPAVE